jgi:transcriptional regulator with XRE-family HTH domain
MLRIRFERQKRQHTIQTLAFLAGVSAARLSEIERGVRRPGPTMRAKLAGAMGLSADELFREIKEAR